MNVRNKIGIVWKFAAGICKRKCPSFDIRTFMFDADSIPLNGFGIRPNQKWSRGTHQNPKIFFLCFHPVCWTKWEKGHKNLISMQQSGFYLSLVVSSFLAFLFDSVLLLCCDADMQSKAKQKRRKQKPFNSSFGRFSIFKQLQYFTLHLSLQFL